MMTLFGYGKTTRAIAQRFGNCQVYDDAFSALTSDKRGNHFHPSEDFDPATSDLEVTSPGIPPSHPLIQKARNLISEYDLFASKMPPSIWISGTNGKTTTTEMIHTLLQDRSAQAGGNIGEPVANLDPDASLWILETSSFTLHYTTIARPKVYVLLPITPDHISWHGSFEAYENAKLKPLSMMQEGDVAIVPKRYAQTPSRAMVIGYEDASDLSQRFEIDLTRVPFDEPFLTDALLALAVEKILFDRVSYEKLEDYRIGRHRVERFQDAKDRTWINDSKATNPDATIAALKGLKQSPIYLILGGDDKGADADTLFAYLKNCDLQIFAIGSNSDTLCHLAKEANITAHNCKTLENAVAQIDLTHTKNSIAILSPAAASLDQFSSYAQRGEKFIELVKNLR